MRPYTETAEHPRQSHSLCLSHPESTYPLQNIALKWPIIRCPAYLPGRTWVDHHSIAQQAQHTKVRETALRPEQFVDVEASSRLNKRRGVLVTCSDFKHPSLLLIMYGGGGYEAGATQFGGGGFMNR